MSSLGLLLIRLVLGLTFAGHGAQKLFGWFGGHGVVGTAGFFDSIGIKPSQPAAVMAGLGEFVGGLMFAAGLLTPIAAAIITVVMVVAIATVSGKNGFWVTENGAEYSVVIIAVAIGVALVGAGAWSIDALLHF
jgi:putative oxidoreductase